MTAQNRGFGAGGRGGYSLVEVSLALLVIGLGLVAAFGLFPEGLRAARRSVDDAQAVAFAQFVFAALEYPAGFTNCDWSDFSSGLELMESHALQADGQPRVTAIDPGDAALDYYWIPQWYGGIEWTVLVHKVARFRYKLVIGQTNGNAKFVRLEVWPGASAGAGPSGPGKVFYREYVPER